MSDCSLYDVLAVPAPVGVAAGETVETAQKKTVDYDSETAVVDQLIRLAG
ncbi:MAG: hypothetical protein M3P44_16005 [Actinomycetota bacterium]|nr:hypothetical protein [Actinomycetota bacterium]